MTGTLYGVGLGPGDPELVTVKAARLISAAQVIAYHSARHGRSIARGVAEPYLREGQIEEQLVYPLTVETTDHPGGYAGAMADFYTESAARLASHLDAGRDVVVLAEGDPMFYGSYMHMHKRLCDRYPTVVVPGVTSVSAASAVLRRPLVEGEEVLTILPGTLPAESLTSHLATTDSAAVLKLGRTFPKVRAAFEAAGKLDRALYVERATWDTGRVLSLSEVDPATVPYFSLAVLPSPINSTPPTPHMESPRPNRGQSALSFHDTPAGTCQEGESSGLWITSGEGNGRAAGETATNGDTGMQAAQGEAAAAGQSGTAAPFERGEPAGQGGAATTVEQDGTITHVGHGESAAERSGTAARTWQSGAATAEPRGTTAPIGEREAPTPTGQTKTGAEQSEAAPHKAGQGNEASQPAASPAPHHPRGEVVVVGLGPAGRPWLTPEAQEALGTADDLVGYTTYLNRVPHNPRQRRHLSDNQVEAERAAFALDLAKRGRRVAVVSSGDPGVFAMATAVLEVADDPLWREVPVRVLPGVTAAHAVAAKAGAPLGHDYCTISLSDRLKPWEVIVRRLTAAAQADFAIAIYNPASKARRWQLGQARDLLLEHRSPDTPVVIGRDVGGPEESLRITRLADLDPATVDMRCLLLVGSSRTRTIRRPDGTLAVFTPRTYGGS
ncbi:precorrin-2 C(20)-methyltransferase [Actinokineospora fastidiosa]|uniref:Tetrapyrrole methylase domain-containing protein n=1 Tax=Actinokineospora fastidiosa TaxID=1816 RepID=A0A918GF65_9PSEU|nr:precorrin-2 C(20)-methyltransferase [Actinokineospora fastidiosa]GGS31953.1 hypothetical protein GCM10010171_27340 [Actinokineospora fastidiosa]